MELSMLRSFLIDVRDMGSARIDRRKLAWMLGRTNLNASAWQLLIEEWEEIITTETTIRGFRIGDEYTFLTTNGEPVTEWTN
jgi:hypothetical protein